MNSKDAGILGSRYYYSSLENADNAAELDVSFDGGNSVIYVISDK